ncbi:hypothetical protein PRIPAC_87733 [Pristionchus pacificus]|uniref:Uncharacterized protein n=1 Tax=Pristionchus pacificus TaxID=54126 RepID=A0A2A6CV81_PRIPA|nr:hypothetical protein PRIPAC_87733 [Pristionchus pacificus]|eukprot:PDM82085.1 hypothetical protein PRIPAC_36478 [Pristionchus pacificus]
MAKNTMRATLLQDQATFVWVICSSVVPAWMNRKEGGATPRNVPQKKGDAATSSTGDVMLMNQLGSRGVTRRKMM